GTDRLEQAAACDDPARGCDHENARQIRRSVSSRPRRTTRVVTVPTPMMRDDLVSLVQQMIDRGIRFDEAQREFERTFIARALTKTNYNVCKAAKMTGLHRNTLSRKMSAYK